MGRTEAHIGIISTEIPLSAHPSSSRIAQTRVDQSRFFCFSLSVTGSLFSSCTGKAAWLRRTCVENLHIEPGGVLHEHSYSEVGLTATVFYPPVHRAHDAERTGPVILRGALRCATPKDREGPSLHRLNTTPVLILFHPMSSEISSHVLLGWGILFVEVSLPKSHFEKMMLNPSLRIFKVTLMGCHGSWDRMETSEERMPLLTLCYHC